MLKLCDLKDPGQSVWLVAPKVTIGRGSNCDMIIADDSVAKLHAEVIVEGEQLLLRHLAERGRTLLNGKPVQKSCPLKCNDELQIGERTLKVLDPKVTKLKKTAPASNVTWALRANHPAIAGKVFPIRESSVVGRSEDCDITFSLSHLSRRHARLEVRDGLLFVTDLGSANGTYLNNRRITESRVRRGDELRFDTLSFSVVGPADDLNETTVRPAVSIPSAKSGPAESPVTRLQVSAAEPTRERRRYEDGGELADGRNAWLWLGGVLVVAVVLGVFWAYRQGLL